MNFTRSSALPLALSSAILITAVILVYGPSIHYPFQFDDRLILRDSNVQHGRWTSVVWPLKPRPLTWLGFLIQYRMGRGEPYCFHATSLFLHAAVSLLALFVLTRFLEIAGSPPRFRLFALVGALVFALHPVQTETVLYVYQQSTLWASLFGLLAILAWLKDRLLLTLLFFVLGVAAKEFMLVLPVVLLGTNVFLKGRRWLDRRLLLPFAVSLFLGLAFFLWVLQSGETTFGGSLQETATYAATQVKALWFYVGLMFVPISLNLDYHVAPQLKLTEPAWWLALGGLVLLFWIVARWSRIPEPGDKRLVGAFFIFLFFAFLLPTSSFFPSQDFRFEHRAYMSVLGFAGLIIIILLKLVERPSRLARASSAALCVFLLTLYVFADLKRREVWKDELALWRDTVSKSPDKYRPNYNLGVLLMEDSPQEAIAYLSKAIEIDPALPLAYRSLGQVYFDQGQLETAARLWHRALSLAPDLETQVRLGELYAKKLDFLRAREHLQKARQLDPWDWRSYYTLAQLNLQFGFTEKAIQECELGLKRNPNHPGLHFLLAQVLARDQKWARAEEFYLRGLEKDPQNSFAYYELAQVYWSMERQDEARAAVLKGISVADTPQETSAGEALLKRFAFRKTAR